MPRRNWLPPLLQCPGFPVFFLFPRCSTILEPRPSTAIKVHPFYPYQMCQEDLVVPALDPVPSLASSEPLPKLRLSASLPWTVAPLPLPPSLPPMSPLHLVFTPEPDFPSSAQMGCVKRSLALSTRDGPLRLSTGCHLNSPRGGLTVANFARLLLSV